MWIRSAVWSKSFVYRRVNRFGLSNLAKHFTFSYWRGNKIGVHKFVIWHFVYDFEKQMWQETWSFEGKLYLVDKEDTFMIVVTMNTRISSCVFRGRGGPSLKTVTILSKEKKLQRRLWLNMIIYAFYIPFLGCT